MMRSARLRGRTSVYRQHVCSQADRERELSARPPLIPEIRRVLSTPQRRFGLLVADPDFIAFGHAAREVVESGEAPGAVRARAIASLNREALHLGAERDDVRRAEGKGQIVLQRERTRVKVAALRGLVGAGGERDAAAGRRRDGDARDRLLDPADGIEAAGAA